MKAEELIVRIAGGTVLGAMLGLILAVMPPEIAGPVRIAMGVLVVVVLATALVGIKYTLRIAMIGSVVFLVLFYFLPDLVRGVLDMVVFYITYVGNFIVNTTTPNVNSAMIAWGLIGLVVSVTLGASAVWSENSRNIRRSG